MTEIADKMAVLQVMMPEIREFDGFDATKSRMVDLSANQSLHAEVA